MKHTVTGPVTYPTSVTASVTYSGGAQSVTLTQKYQDLATVSRKVWGES